MQIIRCSTLVATVYQDMPFKKINVQRFCVEPPTETVKLNGPIFTPGCK